MKGYIFNYLSDMAIDVWRVDPGKCKGISNLPTTTKSPTSKPKPTSGRFLKKIVHLYFEFMKYLWEKLTNFFLFFTGPLTRLTELSCDFDSNTCGLIQSKSDNFDWIRNSGRTKSGKTGPSNDNTLVRQELNFYLENKTNFFVKFRKLPKVFTCTLKLQTLVLKMTSPNF